MTKYNHIYDRIFKKLEENLDPNLTYHNLEHTNLVLNWAREIAKTEGVNKRELALIEIAALYHDCGFLVSREEHEKRGCELARADLADEDFSHEEIESVCGMIMATKIPQNPTNQLERVLVDADLYYLGTDDYDKYSSFLYQELKYFNPSLTDEEWKQIQIKFLETHQYTTDFAKNNLEPAKKVHLERIKKS
ncbi:HD domain-containing protein [Cryomorphaceae bacterium 1068]|nr:HD domain-containing protein [Cryomorphaceae bacterium 1068]